jgi:hypothetical protein
MRYLKLFESFNENEIIDFCETYLAYLLDDTTFKVRVLDNREKTSWNNIQYVWSQGTQFGGGGVSESSNSYVLSLYRERETYRSDTPLTVFDTPYQPMTFYWNDIKDQFIPFLSMLDKNYEILNITFASHVFSYKDVKLDEIEDGVKFAIRSIIISIKK